MIDRFTARTFARIGLAMVVSASAAHFAAAQDRLKSMPGYDQYQRMAPQIAQVAATVSSRMFGQNAATVSWTPDSKYVQYHVGVEARTYDVAAHKTVEHPAPASSPTVPAGRGRGRGSAGGGQPERGRQFADAVAPAGNHRAIYKDRNVWIGDSTGANAVAITTDGSDKTRIKYGTASWVYGEELSQRTAMWWSPDGKKLAFYRFDESKVPDFYLATGLTKVQDTLDVEAYPKSGTSNPVVDLFVYDVDTKATTRVDVRDGKPFENDALGYYVFRVDWSPKGDELTFLRTNRRQNVLEMVACTPTAARCRVVVHEEWPTGWIDDDPAPTIQWLDDGNRFIWESERTGF